MRLTVLAAAAMGCLVALVGFAGTANASATVDLIWIDKTDTACTDDGRRDCPRLGATISSVAVSDDITLAVILTAGPGGVLGAGVSVNYGDVLPLLSVVNFGSLNTEPFLPLSFGTTTKQPPFIDNINAVAAPFFNMGIGLPAGMSAYLGTVTFHNAQPGPGTFEIAVGTNGPGQTDDVLDLPGNVITGTTTFNSAFLVILPTDPPTATPTPTPTPTAPPGEGDCVCAVKNIFPGGQVANIRIAGKPVMFKTLGVQVNAVDAVMDSGLCPDLPFPEGGPTQTAEAVVTLTVTDESGNVLSNGIPQNVTCVSGIEDPLKAVVRFGPENCGPNGGFNVGTFDIFTSVSGTAGTSSRTQRIRCRP